MSDKPQHTLEIEEHLANDDDGSTKKAIEDKLDGYIADVKKQKDAGLRPDEFAVAEKAEAALEAAKSVVDMTAKAVNIPGR